MWYSTWHIMVKLSNIPRLLFQLRHNRKCFPARKNEELCAHSQSTNWRQLLSTWFRCMRRRRSTWKSTLDWGLCSLFSRKIREQHVEVADISRQPKITEFLIKINGFILPRGWHPRLLGIPDKFTSIYVTKKMQLSRIDCTLISELLPSLDFWITCCSHNLEICVLS